MPKNVDPKEIKLAGHGVKPMTNVGTSDPAGEKSETPTKPLPSVAGDQRVERVKVEGEPAVEEETDTE